MVIKKIIKETDSLTTIKMKKDFWSLKGALSGKIKLFDKDKIIKIVSASDLIERLSGSVKVPREFEKMSVKQITQKAKLAYFKNKK